MEKDMIIDYQIEDNITRLFLSDKQEIIVSMHGNDKEYLSIYVENNVLKVIQLNKSDSKYSFEQREKRKQRQKH